VPLSIETMFLERTYVQISLMFAFAVQTFKCVRAWLALFCFKPQWIGFEIGLATLSKLLMVLGFVRTIILNVF